MATKKLLDHILSLACAPLRIHCPEDGEDVFDQEVCLDMSGSVVVVGFVVVWSVCVFIVLLDKSKDSQLAAEPRSGTR